MLLRQLLGAAIAMLTTVFLARNLSLGDNGMYASLTLLPVMAASIASLGVGPSIAFQCSTKRYALSEIIACAMILSIACAAVMTAILAIALLFGFFPHDLEKVKKLAFIAIFSITPVLLFTNLSAALQGMQRFKEFGLLTIAPPATLLAALILLYAIDTKSITLENITYSFAGAYIASTITAAIFFKREFNEFSASRFRSYRDCAQSIISYGLKAHLANVLSVLNYRLNYYIILALGGSSNLGLFAVTASLCEALWMLSSAAGTIVFPLVAANKDSGESTKISLQVARWVFYLTSIATVILLIAASSDILISLFSEKFSPISTALYVLSPGIISLSFARVLANDIAGRGDPTINTKIAAISLLVNTTINVLTIKEYGIIGVAAASSISYIVLSMLTVKAYSNITGSSTIDILRPHFEDIQTARHLLRRVMGAFSK